MTGPRYLTDLVHRPADTTATGPRSSAQDGELSYTALWERVGGGGRLLRRARVRPGDLVGLYLHRSADYVTALLATLAVGAVAVPIDPELPSGRAEQMLTGGRAPARRCTPTVARRRRARVHRVAGVARQPG